MKLIVRSSKLANIFTSSNVYSNKIDVSIRFSILSALISKKLSLSLSNSYTHTAKNLRTFIERAYLIVGKI